MGRVFRARDTSTGDEVALKVLDLQQPIAISMFEREYHTLSSIDHPSVVQVYEFGRTEEGLRYFTMELVEGDDLYSLAPVPWQTLCAYLREVATALSLLHARGLVHRDISPRNVRIDQEGRVRLLDFGALSAFGETNQLVGTPVCTAPEAVRRMPLDARSDLYSLGATAYIGLTRKRPFSIKHWNEAEDAWQSRPTPLPQLVADMPEELNELVMSLLSVDVRERPATAADVIEQLETIGKLTEVERVSAARGHLASPRLIGRDRELGQLRQHLNHAIRGQGLAVAIEGAPRIGRTRLTHDLCIDAQLAGAAAVRVDGTASRESGSLLRRLCAALLEAVPKEAGESLSGYPDLVETIEQLQQPWLGPERPSRPNTRRTGGMETPAEVASAAVRWTVGITARRPLVVVIEDAQALDHASAGLLFGLAHACQGARMLLVFTLASNVKPPKAVEQTAAVASSIKLRNLSPEALEELLRSVFGDVPRLPRLAGWLYAVAEGNPGHSLDLLSDLVQRGTLRWMSGSWTLPTDLSSEALPSSLEEALASRLAGLPAGALHLARLLALHPTGASLPLCQQLFADRAVDDEDEVFRHLDLLVERQIAHIVGDYYRISQEALRRALLEGASEDEEQQLHRTMGEALIGVSVPEEGLDESSPIDSIGTALQAGWHLLHGGQEERGRDLLRTTGILLTRRGDGLTEAVPALEAALESYKEQGRSEYEQGYLMSPLVLAGTYIDFRLTYRYSERLVGLMVKASGLSTVRKLQRFLPGKLALGLGLLSGLVLRPLTKRKLATRSFRETMLAVIGLASATIGTYSALGDAKSARRLIRLMHPLGNFPKSHPAFLAYELQVALKECSEGDYASALRRGHRTLDALTAPDGVRGLPEEARLQFVTGLYILVGSMDVYRTDGRVHETLAALDRVGTPLAKETAAGIRANYHAGRGEMRKSAEAREQVDVLAAQGGSPWRQDVLMPRCVWWIEAQCEDSLGLRRTVRQLETLTRDSEAIKPIHAGAHAAYLADRGLADEALERYEPVLKEAVQETTPLSMRMVGAYARVLRLAGRASQALSLTSAHLSKLSHDERELSCLIHGAQIERGLALLAVGDAHQAESYLDQVCAAQDSHDNPLLHVLSHRARAEVAIAQRDAEAFDKHMSIAQRWAGRADYPALYGQLQRTVSSARRANLTGHRTLDALQGERSRHSTQSVTELMGACRGPAQRQQTALDILVDRSQAASGFLYLLESAGLRFAAPLHGAEPPEDLLGELSQRLTDFRDLDDETLATLMDESPLHTVVGHELDADPVSRVEARLGSPYRPLFLTFEEGDTLEVVGVVALVEGSLPLRPIDSDTLQAVALAVYDAGDATAYR